MTSRRQFLQTSALLGTAGLLASPRRATANPRWENITYGRPATDIAIGQNGTYWMLGTDAKPGGYGLYSLESTFDWHPDRASSASAGVRIAVDQSGEPWVVTSNNQIWRRSKGSKWEQLPGTATDIAIGGVDTVWMLDATAKPGGYGLWRWQWRGQYWEPDEVSGSAGVQISIEPHGQPSVVTSDGEIWARHAGPGWYRIPGSATEVSQGPSGDVWMIGTDAKPGGYGIWQQGSVDWKQDSASASSAGLRIAVGQTGTLIVVNSANELWELYGWATPR